MNFHARLKAVNYPTRLFRLSACTLAAAAMLAACGGGDNGPPANETAQVIYKNGDVLTLDKDDAVAQAVGVRDGKIIAVGTAEQVDAYAGPDTRIVDLGGKTLIPGIYDAHSHFVYAGMIAKFDTDLNSPPIGTVDSIEDVVALLKQKQQELGPDAWITGFGYDDSLLAERRHPTRADLDRVSTTQPVYITHISGHMSVANSVALEIGGVTAATPDPVGGVIGKDAAGEPTGFLAENAMTLVGAHKPAMSGEQMMEAVTHAGQVYASQGVTTANDGAASAGSVALLESAAQNGNLPVRVVVLPTGLSEQDAARKVELTSGKVKVGGIKDFHDGSIQGYTGYLTEPYHTPYEGDADYRGYPRSSKEALVERVVAAHKAGRQLFIHANGDEAISDVLYAYRKAQEASPREGARHVVIHSQMAREEQLDDMQALDVMPSFFELHTYYWGDRHRDVFMGPDRARRMSPLQSAKSRGLVYTVHADTPVVPMDPMLMIWAAVNRVSTSGEVIGGEQTVSPMEALRATTINAAYQNFEEEERGSIEVGKWADLVVLSANPVKVDPMTIRDIQVLETIVEGETVFEKTAN